jgi:hypothetical protein
MPKVGGAKGDMAITSRWPYFKQTKNSFSISAHFKQTKNNFSLSAKVCLYLQPPPPIQVLLRGIRLQDER